MNSTNVINFRMVSQPVSVKKAIKLEAIENWVPADPNDWKCHATRHEDSYNFEKLNDKDNE